MSLRLQVLILGARADAKSVKWRHMHCVGPVLDMQPPPTNACGNKLAHQNRTARAHATQSDAPA